jgi:hypothetical protein
VGLSIPQGKAGRAIAEALRFLAGCFAGLAVWVDSRGACGARGV